MSQRLLASPWREARWFAAGLLLAELVVATPALAQGSGAPSTKAQATAAPGDKAAPVAPADRDKEARKLYQRGLQALNAKQWEPAREAFLEAFKLKPHPQIAANLGNAELMGGRYRDAAEHLSFVVREAPNMGEKDRQDIEKLLEGARAKIGTVTVRVNVEGARVLMDGQEVGVSPLAVPLFVEPGRRVFEAQKDGLAPERLDLEVAAGSAPVVELTLAPPAPAVQAPAAVPRLGVVEAPREAARPDWQLRVVALAAGVAVMGVGLSIGFSVAAARDDSAATKEHDAVAQRTVVGKLVCPMGYDEPRCHKFAELARTRDVYQNVAVTSLVVGGAAAVGAAVAALWWPRKAAPPGHPPTSFMILPSPQGAVVMGSF